MIFSVPILLDVNLSLVRTHTLFVVNSRWMMRCELMLFDVCEHLSYHILTCELFSIMFDKLACFTLHDWIFSLLNYNLSYYLLKVKGVFEVCLRVKEESLQWLIWHVEFGSNQFDRVWGIIHSSVVTIQMQIKIEMMFNMSQKLN